VSEELKRSDKLRSMEGDGLEARVLIFPMRLNFRMGLRISRDSKIS
jgi:hypothetical protein